MVFATHTSLIPYLYPFQQNPYYSRYSHSGPVSPLGLSGPVPPIPFTDFGFAVEMLHALEYAVRQLGDIRQRGTG
jgi:hypothetical protein